MTAAAGVDVEAEVAAITAAFTAAVDPAYEAGMRRTVPSGQKAHAVRVPEIRRIAVDWSRAHKGLAFEQLMAVAEALWETEWREERVAAITLLGRSKKTETGLDWDVVERWSRGIDNWEHVDHMAGAVTGPMLVARPSLLTQLTRLSQSGHVWQRRLAIVTLIEAAREDEAWLGELRAMTAALGSDRGPTMRKAVDWARRTADKVEAKSAG